MTTTENPLLNTALYYAERGWPVFPLHQTIGDDGCSCPEPECDSQGKHPRTNNGFKNATTDPEQIKKWWSKWPDANIGLRTGKQSGLLVIDSDEKNGKSGKKSIRQAGLNMPETWAVKTPSGGLHYLYQYPEDTNIGCPGSGLEGVDIRGEGGYVVAPPSVIYGTPYAVAKQAEIVPLPSQWVGQLTNPRQRAKHAPGEPILEGGRNNTLAALAGSMRHKGFSVDAIEAALLAENAACCIPPEDEEKVLRIARSYGRYLHGDRPPPPVDFSKFKPPSIKTDGNPSPASGPKYVIRRYDGLKLSSPDWQVKGVMEYGTLVEWFGGWGEGKTFVILDLLLCIATGADFHGRPVGQGPVVYFCGEGQRGLTRRLHAWEIENGIKLAEHPFYICTTPASLCKEGDAEAVINCILAEEVTPVHVCLDTRSRNFGAGDENSPKDMGQFLNACDAIRNKFGCTVSAIHHPGHGDKSRSRGHSAWQGALDVSYQVNKTLDEIISVAIGKPPKDFEPPEPFAFRLTQIDLGIEDEDGKSVTSCVLRPTGIPASPKKLQGDAQKEMFDILKRLTPETSPTEGPVDLGLVPASDWKAACITAGRSANTFYSARRRLIEKKLVFEVGDSVRINE